MPISDYLRDVRRRVGRRLLLVPAVAAVIRDATGAILVERRADNGAWGLPAGAIDPGETPAAAIVREVREETGLEVVPDRILGVVGGRSMRTRYPNGDLVEYTAVVFACHVAGGRLQPLDGEATELAFVAPERASALIPAYPPALLRPPAHRDPWFEPFLKP